MWEVIVIPADPKQSMYKKQIREELKEIQTLVDGYVEHVTIGNCIDRKRFGTPENSVGMWVNEDGIAKGKSQNDRAAILYGVLVHGSGIYGDAVLTGEIMDPEEGREIAPLPEPYDSLESWVRFFSVIQEAYPMENIPAL